jgi:hypothetical protein
MARISAKQSVSDSILLDLLAGYKITVDLARSSPGRTKERLKLVAGLIESSLEKIYPACTRSNVEEVQREIQKNRIPPRLSF